MTDSVKNLYIIKNYIRHLLFNVNHLFLKSFDYLNLSNAVALFTRYTCFYNLIYTHILKFIQTYCMYYCSIFLTNMTDLITITSYAYKMNTTNKSFLICNTYMPCTSYKLLDYYMLYKNYKVLFGLYFVYWIYINSVHNIMSCAMLKNLVIKMPVVVSKYTILRSPHVDKKSREQYEMKIHKYYSSIRNISSRFIVSLSNMQLPSGIGYFVKENKIYI